MQSVPGVGGAMVSQKATLPPGRAVTKQARKLSVQTSFQSDPQDAITSAGYQVKTELLDDSMPNRWSLPMGQEAIDLIHGRTPRYRSRSASIPAIASCNSPVCRVRRRPSTRSLSIPGNARCNYSDTRERVTPVRRVRRRPAASAACISLPDVVSDTASSEGTIDTLPQELGASASWLDVKREAEMEVESQVSGVMQNMLLEADERTMHAEAEAKRWKCVAELYHVAFARPPLPNHGLVPCEAVIDLTGVIDLTVDDEIVVIDLTDT